VGKLKREKWAGGRVVVAEDGSRTWTLEAMRKGQRYSITLEVTSEALALAEWALFERDPIAYQTGSEARAQHAAELVQLTTELVTRFLKYLAGEGGEIPARSERYRDDTLTALEWWGKQLGSKDLRRVKLKELTAALDREPAARKHKIIALKSFCSWLRERGELDRADDASIDLKVPPPTPERASREKGYAMPHVAAIYAHLTDQAVRDFLCVQSRTGLHCTEVDRLASGTGKVTPVEGHGTIAAVLRVDHKNGRVHMQSIDAQALAALQRLLSRGSAPVDSWRRKMIAEAAKAARLKPINLGEMRHSFTTWAETSGSKVMPAEAGVPLHEVSLAIGHGSVATTEKFYRGTKVPPMITVPLVLKHAKDPLPLLQHVPNGRAVDK
jgi:integrase